MRRVTSCSAVGAVMSSWFAVGAAAGAAAVVAAGADVDFVLFIGRPCLSFRFRCISFLGRRLFNLCRQCDVMGGWVCWCVGGCMAGLLDV